MSAGQETEAQYRAGDERGDAQSSYLLGRLLAERGEMAEAEAAFARADARGHATSAARLGMFAEARGDHAGAKAAYRRADERGDGLGAMRLGLLLANEDDWEGAKAAWARASERGQPDPAHDLDPLFAVPHEAPLSASPPRSVLSSPVLVGALSVLIVMVAVFLAFNANAGLPFVPTKTLKVDIADGADLVVGNDVREGGFRIGLVSAMNPVKLPTGATVAQLTLKLAESNAAVPVDSTVSIRSRSVLGLKYVEIAKGTSPNDFQDGATLPIQQTNVPVQIDRIFDAFDPRTRKAIQHGLVGFGDTLAGRGSSLNDTIAVLPKLLSRLQPVATYLADPNTQLTRFLDNLNRFMGTIAPVAQTQAQLFTDLATTFAAIDRDPNALEQTIARSPSTLQVSTASLAVQQPFLVHLTTLAHNLAPATAELKAALPVINPAIEAGTRTLALTPPLDRNLQQVMVALRQLAQSPGTNIALNGLTSTVGILNPMIRYLGPYVTVCNDWNYWWADLAGDIDEETSFGYAQRALLNQTNAAQTNNVNSAGATAPVNGGVPDTPLGGNEFSHSPNYASAIDNKGFADCEVGQRGYPQKLNYFDPQGRKFDSDPHTPGDQGTTYAGLLRVPKGETFSRNPQTGPQLTYNPSNP